jgi:rubrerythrin
MDDDTTDKKTPARALPQRSDDILHKCHYECIKCNFRWSGADAPWHCVRCQGSRVRLLRGVPTTLLAR